MTTPRDEGAASLELVVLTPALVLLLGLLVLVGRVTLAGTSVEQAADEAARSASIARTAAGAQRAAEDGAMRALAEQDLRCGRVDVAVDVGGFSVPVGQAARVTATVTCVVALADLALPGFPGSRTVTATAVSPLDTYRERG
ncbi:MAG TPA: TadE/TadG family type IV pilus assembly protein [Kineosporiaceae bacterium]|nr:TadE/TadG family type IV pilus assembly protein [Kineosporiaceae bacterium]